MFTHIRANLMLLGLTVVVCSVVYPLAVLAVGQAIFPTSANGNILTGSNGNPVGSSHIAQDFQGDEWFHPRPSAAGYNAAASSGSNLGANNPKLRERVQETLKTRTETSSVPVDAVTTSGSGLDPHITLKNAEGQLDRVATTWAKRTGADVATVRRKLVAILQRAAFQPLAGFAGGEPLVNVLEVNLALHRELTHNP